MPGRVRSFLLVRVQRLQQCLTIQPLVRQELEAVGQALRRRWEQQRRLGSFMGVPPVPARLEVTVYDTDGKNKMDKSNGCVFSATQNLFDASAKGDRTQSEYRADSILDSYKKNSHLSNVSTEPARDDSALVKDTDGNAIETRRVDMTYTGEDQKDYRLTGFVRVFTTTSTPVLLQGMYACPVDAYSSSEMKELLEATPISHPGPADMDEGESGSGSGKDGKSDGKKSGSDDGKATAPSGKSDEKGSGGSSKDT